MVKKSRIFDAFDEFLLPATIGFDTYVSSINRNLSQSYPPYDVEKFDDDNYAVTVSVAGFAKDELSVTVHNNRLNIEGLKKIPDEEDTKVYLHKGIAARAFTRTFVLGEYFEVDTVSLENGLLEVKLTRRVPEEHKPKIIEIR